MRRLLVLLTALVVAVSYGERVAAASVVLMPPGAGADVFNYDCRLPVRPAPSTRAPTPPGSDRGVAGRRGHRRSLKSPRPAAKAGEEEIVGATAFHHTTTEAVESIMRQGLRPDTYVMPTPGLGPLQAHIELALNPAGGARNAVVDVDLAGLRRAGYEIPQVRRVSGAYKMAGGGYEMQFPYEIPPEYLSVRPR